MDYLEMSPWRQYKKVLAVLDAIEKQSSVYFQGKGNENGYNNFNNIVFSYLIFAISRLQVAEQHHTQNLKPRKDEVVNDLFEMSNILSESMHD
ncbi:hypothetical protein ACTXT7_001016 [Hymenolepis weldensis]